MEYIFIGVGIALAILIITIILINRYYNNKYAFLYIKVKEADNNLDILLEKKVEILTKLLSILEEKKVDDNIPDIARIKNKRMDHHELFNELTNIHNETIKIIETYETKLNEEKLISLIDKLNDNECDLRAALKYYNDSTTEIEFLAHKFPSNIIRSIHHYEHLEPYKIQKTNSIELLNT